jgi:hypothetical protein
MEKYKLIKKTMLFVLFGIGSILPHPPCPLLDNIGTASNCFTDR